jgi:hypothetical protein
MVLCSYSCNPVAQEQEAQAVSTHNVDEDSDQNDWGTNDDLQSTCSRVLEEGLAAQQVEAMRFCINEPIEVLEEEEDEEDESQLNVTDSEGEEDAEEEVEGGDD